MKYFYLILLFPVICFSQWGVWSQWGYSLTGFTITADTTGQDSITSTASTFDLNTDSTFAYATLTQDLPTKDSMATALADTSHNDSLLTWTFLTGLVDQATVYIYYGVQDHLGNVVWDSTLINVPDMWSPDAGTLAYFNFVPPYNDSLSVDSSLTADATILEIRVTKSANDSWTLLSYISNADIDSSFSLTGILSYIGSDTQFVQLIWYDDEENPSTAILDTILPTGTPDSYVYLGTYDSTHTVLDSFKVLINDSAVSSSANYFVLASEDTVTGLDNDTLEVNLPDTLIINGVDTVYVWSIIIFTSGQSPDTSEMATYPVRGGTPDDEDAPNIEGTFVVEYAPTDSFRIVPTSLGTDSLDYNYIKIVLKEEDGDSIIVYQYTQTASEYTLNFTNNPANFSWSNDSLLCYAVVVDDSGNVSDRVNYNLVIHWDWITAKTDTARHTLLWMRLYRNEDDSTLVSPIDSLYQFSMEDGDTLGLEGDTIKVAIPEALRYAYFNIKGMFSGDWSHTFDAWLYWNEVTVPTNFTATVADDSDLVNIAVTEFGAEFKADTSRIQWSNSAYPANKGAGTTLWAGNPQTDSAQVNDDDIALTVGPDETFYGRIFVGHKANDHWNITTDSDTAVFPALSPPAVGDCTFEWHAESNATITNETPAGYSAGDVLPAVNSGAVISSAQFSDGDSSVSIPSANDRFIFSISSEDILAQDSGTVSFDIRVTTRAVADYMTPFAIDADNYLTFQGFSSGNNDVQLTWEGNNTIVTIGTVTDFFTADTWYNIIIRWRQGTVDPSLSLEVVGQSTVTSNTNLTAMTSDPANFWVGVLGGGANGVFIDNVKVWKYWRP